MSMHGLPPNPPPPLCGAGASAPEVLAAVRELAKPRSGLKVVDTVEEVVNTLKVLRSLEDMATVLRVG
eukprot:349722-Chlamydomonas_euryale.AAC.2